MTIAMLGLAGIPATAGFIGKFYLIDAAVDSGYTWLGVVIVIGSMISLGYYLRVIAAMWMRDAPQPAAATAGRHWRARRSPAARPSSTRLSSGDGRLPDGSLASRRWRSSRCSPAPPRSCSGSCPSRCSISCSTPAAPSPGCSEPRR